MATPGSSGPVRRGTHLCVTVSSLYALTASLDHHGHWSLPRHQQKVREAGRRTPAIELTATGWGTSVTLSHEDLIREVLTNRWHAPILRGLANGPARYVEIRASLIELKGESPGDGYISRELRELRELGLVDRRHIPEARRPAWIITDLGVRTMASIDSITATPETAPDGSTHDTRRYGMLKASIDPDSELGTGSRTTGRRESLVTDPIAEPTSIDTSVPHPARRYNYWLGGKDNFAADRESGDEFERMLPGLRAGVRANRDLLRRAVRYLTAEQGIRQFLDIGTGLPTADNTHEVAQAVAPESRIVYVDNDPLVLTHARALLTSSPEGKTAYIEADLRDPEAILQSPTVNDTLDLSKPVAVILVAVLHFIAGHGAAKPIVRRLMEAVPSGSFLVVTHGTADFLPPEIAAAHQQMIEQGRSDIWPRDKAEITSLFEGLELIHPGIVPNSRWRPESGGPEIDLKDVAGWTGVGRKR